MNKPGQISLLGRVLTGVGVGVGIVALAVIYALASLHTGKSIAVGWLGLAGFTPLVFWTVIKASRRHWKRPAFWLAVGALMTVHILMFGGTLLYYPQWPLLWFIPVSIVEAAMFVVILAKLFDDNKRSRA